VKSSPTKFGIAVFLSAVTLATGACGSTKKEDKGAAVTTSSIPDATPTTGGDPGPSATSQATKPVISIPDAPPPTQLQSKDLVVGTGAVAASGRKVTVQYVGVAYSTKKQFDASWDRPGQPFSFQLGAGQVIPGWDQGVPGMKVGGRRELVIPPNLGYGDAGYPPVIKPGETLVFVIDLVAA